MTAFRSISYFAAAALLLAVAAVLLLPVAAVYVQAIADAETVEPLSLFDLERQVPLLMRSMMVAAGAAAIALVLGLTVGLAALQLRPFARTAIACTCAVSLLTPPYVFAVAWIDIWGPAGWLSRWAPQDPVAIGAAVYSVPGAAIALAAAYYPIVAITAFTALRRLDIRSREAATVSGRANSYVTHIALPLLVRPVTAAVLAVFVLALYDFPVHSLLQVDTYLVEIHAASEYHDYRAAALLSVPLLCIAAVSIAFALVLTRGRGRVSDAGVSSRSRDMRRTGNRWWAGIGWTTVALTSVLPIAAVTIRAMPPSTFTRLFETAWQELVTSLVLAAITASAITVLGTAFVVTARARSRIAVADILSVVPFLISGPLLGLGLIAVYNRPGVPGAIYDSAAILLIAWTARYAFIAQWGIGAGVRGQSPTSREAARVAGVSWVRTQWGVVIGQARPYIAMVWGAAFILTFREIDTAVLVAPPGMTLASVRLFTLMHYGPDGYVMAMALTMSAVLFLTGAAIYALAGPWQRINDARS